MNGCVVCAQADEREARVVRGAMGFVKEPRKSERLSRGMAVKDRGVERTKQKRWSLSAGVKFGRNSAHGV